MTEELNIEKILTQYRYQPPPESIFAALNDLIIELGYSSKVHIKKANELGIGANNCLFHGVTERQPKVSIAISS